ncbi:MAG: hypothetical protein ACYC0I_09140, partial [Acidimicrobiales bacterium]
AQFTLPSRIQNGPSSLAVVASGFASSPVSVTVLGGVNAPAASKKRTIVCVRGKKLKRVTAARPFCPSGFKVKKR